jgi:hypothetical protein
MIVTGQQLVNSHNALADALALAKIIAEKNFFACRRNKLHTLVPVTDLWQKKTQRRQKLMFFKDCPVSAGWEENASSSAKVQDYSGLNAGPTTAISDSDGPATLFQKFFDMECLKFIAASSHAKAKTRGDDQISFTITPGSLLVCFGVLVRFGALKTRVLGQAWSIDEVYALGDPIARRAMTYKAFAFHLTNLAFPPAEKQSDPLRKVRWLLDHINRKCGEMFTVVLALKIL